MKLIVGLGNPGTQYTNTRHNIGFLSLELLAAKYRATLRKSTAVDGWIAEIDVDGQQCSLLMPATFMNNSGVAVKKMVIKKGVSSADILVICDDLSLPFGQQRIRPLGSSGGQNGLKSVIEHLGTNEFARLRLGISRPKVGVDAADYVLSNFTTVEKKSLPDLINNALLCVHCWVTQGVKEAMNSYNKKDNR